MVANFVRSPKEKDFDMQTISDIPVGHKTLRLRQLQPKLSPAFSPNLYRWMRESAHF